MSQNRKLADNVYEFLKTASSAYGKIKEESFYQEMYCQLIEGEIKSPIEDLFFIACHVIAEYAYIDINPEPTYSKKGELELGCGIFIHPQFKIGKFKVDFIMSQNGIGPSELMTPVIVELDGHEFHDKDKKQRAYEKSRDRFFVSSGYRVLHFTGSEVYANPAKVAHEALNMLGFDACSGQTFDQINPFRS